MRQSWEDVSMVQTQQQIEEHVRYLIDKIEELEKNGGQDAK
jgi:hypothetical protein